MSAELFAVSHCMGAILRGRRLLFTSFFDSRTSFPAATDLPPEVGEVAALACTIVGTAVINRDGVVFEWDAATGAWTRLGAVSAPVPVVQTGPEPGSRGVLREPAPRDGSERAATVRCRALRAFAVGGGIDCVAGDEVELAFERANRLSDGHTPMVEILDKAAFRKGEQAAVRAAESWR